MGTQTSARVITASSTLADRLAVARAAEPFLGASRRCGHVGCQGHASSTVRGIPLCPGHAGFAAVRSLRGKVAA